MSNDYQIGQHTELKAITKDKFLKYFCLQYIPAILLKLMYDLNKWLICIYKLIFVLKKPVILL